MTIRHCYQCTDVVSHPSNLYFLVHPYSLKKPHNFSTSQSFPSSILMSPWILCFFLLSFHWGQSCKQCFIINLLFPHAAFPHISGCLFLNIKCPWVNLVCSMCILLGLTSYYLQLFWELSHSSMCS